MEFIHLRAHSAYSLLEGTLPVKKLVALACKRQMPALALTDTANMFGALDFSQACADEGIQPIIGTLLRLALPDDHVTGESFSYAIMPVYASNEVGYLNLLKLSSKSFLESPELTPAHVTLETLLAHSDGVICLTGGASGPLGQFLLSGRKAEAEAFLSRLQQGFGDRLYMEIARLGEPGEAETEDALLDLAYRHDIPLVATNDVLFATEDMHEAHDALLCIADGRYVNEADRRQVTAEHRFKTVGEMKALFADLPEALANTVVIAQRCHWLVPLRDPILPPATDGGAESEAEELRRQSREGLEVRLAKHVWPEEGASEAEKEALAKPYRERLDFELGVINQMGFPGYFLIVADFIKWAKAQGIPVGPGRGSGAGSVVAWALTITDLDPIQLGLLFERFLNPERVSMPDFDVDFCKDRRDEVIDYVRRKYGADKVAQIITFGSLMSRAVVRDVGRVLEMPYGQRDKIAKLIPANPANPVKVAEAVEGDETLREMVQQDSAVKRLIEISVQLEGLYRNAGTHAAGVVIGDRPLDELVPLFRDPRSDKPVTQFNMKAVEKAGLVKFDFLGLKTLTVLQTAVDFLKERGIELDLSTIPLDDAQVYDDICKGETVGIFQLESTGMRSLMRQGRPRAFEDIIAFISLYRPGPMDNIPSFCAKRDGREEVTYMHPLLEPILKETSGIMVYQEQVMEAAQVLAGYTLGAADLLRRAMGKKIKEEMDQQREIFIEGCKTHHAIDGTLASEIFDQIAKFAGYGFNKSHAAAYALISWQTAWLKTHYPVEFMAASMAHDLNDTDKLAIFKQELERLNIPLLPPDINASQPNMSVEPLANGGYGVRFALAGIKGVGRLAMEAVVTEREAHGVYKDVFDFAQRLDGRVMNKKQMENLIRAGAFDSLNSNRRQLYEATEMLCRFSQAAHEDRESAQNNLFASDAGGVVDLPRPELPTCDDWRQLERLRHEFESLGFYISAHPLDEYKQALRRLKTTTQAEIRRHFERGQLPQGRVKLAAVVSGRKEKRSARGNKFAWVQLSDQTGSFEAMCYSEVLMQSRDLLEAGQLVLCHLDIENRDDAPSFLLQRVEVLEEIAARTSEGLEIELADARDAGDLARILGSAEAGRMTITLCLSLDNRERVEIELPQSYRLSVEQRVEIDALGSVLRLREL